MFPITYYRPYYCKCLGIQQGGNTSPLLSVGMYPESGGVDENGMVMTLHWKLAVKEDHLLRGTIDDIGGIHNKL